MAASTVLNCLACITLNLVCLLALVDAQRNGNDWNNRADGPSQPSNQPYDSDGQYYGQSDPYKNDRTAEGGPRDRYSGANRQDQYPQTHANDIQRDQYSDSNRRDQFRADSDWIRYSAANRRDQHVVDHVRDEYRADSDRIRYSAANRRDQHVVDHGRDEYRADSDQIQNDAANRRDQFQSSSRYSSNKQSAGTAGATGGSGDTSSTSGETAPKRVGISHWLDIIGNENKLVRTYDATPIVPPSNYALDTKIPSIYLGVGSQNYTCVTGAYVSIGAVATLFSAATNTISGHHYHKPYPSVTAGVPVFVLTNYGEVVGAPTAVRTPSANPYSADDITRKLAVANGQLGERGWSYFVRVVTAGGKPPASCDLDGAVLAVPYTAYYLFFHAV